MAKSRGITNKQAKYLASLQRWAGEKYSGNGMSRLQAADEIERLVKMRDYLRASQWEELEAVLERDYS